MPWKLWRVRDTTRLAFPTVPIFAPDLEDAVAVASLRLFGISSKFAKGPPRQVFVTALGVTGWLVELDGGSGPDRAFTIDEVVGDCVVRR